MESRCFQLFWAYQEDQPVCCFFTPDADVHGSSSLMAQEDGDGHWRVLISLSGSSPPRRDHNQVAKLSSAIRTIATNQGASMNSWWRETILFQLYFQRPLKLAILEPPMSAEGLSVIWQSSIAGAPDASYS